MKQDKWADVQGERHVYAKSWQLFERYHNIPIEKGYRSEWDKLAADCIELSRSGDEYGPAVVAMAYGQAHSIYGYFKEKLSLVDWD